MSANVVEMPIECECCPVTLASLRSETPAKSLVKFKTMWMCPACYRKEVALDEQSKAEAEQRVAESRAISANNLIEFSRKQDQSVQVVTDIHNAYTVQIMELEAAIQNDETIPADKKHVTLASELHTRYAHLAKVMFDARTMLAEAGNQQRAIQTYMNTLSNKLREDERAKFVLADISYNVEKQVKRAKKASVANPAKQAKKIPSMNECKAAAEKFGVAVELIRMRLTRVTGESAEQAAQAIAKKLTAVK